MQIELNRDLYVAKRVQVPRTSHLKKATAVVKTSKVMPTGPKLVATKHPVTVPIAWVVSHKMFDFMADPQLHHDCLLNQETMDAFANAELTSEFTKVDTSYVEITREEYMQEYEFNCSEMAEIHLKKRNCVTDTSHLGKYQVESFLKEYSSADMSSLCEHILKSLERESKKLHPLYADCLMSELEHPAYTAVVMKCILTDDFGLTLSSTVEAVRVKSKFMLSAFREAVVELISRYVQYVLLSVGAIISHCTTIIITGNHDVWQCCISLFNMTIFTYCSIALSSPASASTTSSSSTTTIGSLCSLNRFPIALISLI